MFSSIKSELDLAQLSCKSTPYGSPYGSQYDQNGEYFSKILDDLNDCDSNNRGHVSDAVNLELCIYENLCIITNDKCLCEIASKIGVNSAKLEDLICQ